MKYLYLESYGLLYDYKVINDNNNNNNYYYYYFIQLEKYSSMRHVCHEIISRASSILNNQLIYSI